MNRSRQAGERVRRPRARDPQLVSLRLERCDGCGELVLPSDGDVVDPASQTVTLIASASSRTGPETTFQKLADKLRPLTKSCQSLSAAVASVRSAATSLGLSESARTYELDAVTDNSFPCASIYETVGGTIFLTLRGPNG